MRVLPTLFAVLVTASLAQAQAVTILPTVGYQVSDKPLGLVSPNGELVALNSAPTVGLGIEVQTKFPFLVFRGAAQSTINGGLSRLVPNGITSCGANCSKVERVSQPFKDGASVLNLSVSAVLRPKPSSTISPYLLMGVGLKRHDLGRGIYRDGEASYTLGGRESTIAAQVGSGVSFLIGRNRFEVGAVDYISGFSNGGYVESFANPLSNRALHQLRHDLNIGLSMRVPLF